LCTEPQHDEHVFLEAKKKKKIEIGPVLQGKEIKRDAWYAIFLAEVTMNSGEIDLTDEQQYNVTNSD